MTQLEEKKIFLLATSLPQRATLYSNVIQKHFNNPTVFISPDGSDAIFKVDNFPPHILIIDQFLPKLSGLEVTERILRNEKYSKIAIIIAADLPDRDHFVENVITGRVQFLTEYHNDVKLTQTITKALNYIASGDVHEYRLRFLPAQEVLFSEGDQATSVFIVKRGELQAFKGNSDSQTLLGNIHVGEFVGEMAHINSEPRSATVKALTDCELIEIPRDSLDMVLFSKPAWSRALVNTLSKRLKKSNAAIS